MVNLEDFEDARQRCGVPGRQHDDARCSRCGCRRRSVRKHVIRDVIAVALQSLRRCRRSRRVLFVQLGVDLAVEPRVLDQTAMSP